MVVVVMGVSGAGKTTVGHLLASKLDWEFFDADDYHSPANIEKMRSGTPLTDADRACWLETLRNLIAGWIENRKNAVLACSALRHIYRDVLRAGPEVIFVYLKVSPNLLHERLHSRLGHFMSEQMLASQLATLEEPEHAIVIDADGALDEIVEAICKRLPDRGQA